MNDEGDAVEFSPRNTRKVWSSEKKEVDDYFVTRSLGALRAPTSSWRPFGHLGFVLRALRALRPCDPRAGDWIVC